MNVITFIIPVIISNILYLHKLIGMRINQNDATEEYLLYILNQ